MPHINRTIFMPVDLLEAFSKSTGLSWSSLWSMLAERFSYLLASHAD